MTEKVLDIIWVMRLHWMQWVLEVLVITPNYVFATRAGKRWTDASAYGATDIVSGVSYLIGSAIDEKQEKKKIREFESRLRKDLEGTLKTDKHVTTIPTSEITEVSLEKGMIGLKLHIDTKKKTHKWYAKGIGFPSPSIAHTAPREKIEDFEKILTRVFPDKLSVKR